MIPSLNDYGMRYTAGHVGKILPFLQRPIQFCHLLGLRQGKSCIHDRLFVINQLFMALFRPKFWVDERTYVSKVGCVACDFRFPEGVCDML